MSWKNNNSRFNSRFNSTVNMLLKATNGFYYRVCQKALHKLPKDVVDQEKTLCGIFLLILLSRVQILLDVCSYVQ